MSTNLSSWLEKKKLHKKKLPRVVLFCFFGVNIGRRRWRKEEQDFSLFLLSFVGREKCLMCGLIAKMMKKTKIWWIESCLSIGFDANQGEVLVFLELWRKWNYIILYIYTQKSKFGWVELETGNEQNRAVVNIYNIYEYILLKIWI